MYRYRRPTLRKSDYITPTVLEYRQKEIEDVVNVLNPSSKVRLEVKLVSLEDILLSEDPFTPLEIQFIIDVLERLKNEANLMEGYLCLKVMLMNQKEERSYRSKDDRLDRFLLKNNKIICLYRLLLSIQIIKIKTSVSTSPC